MKLNDYLARLCPLLPVNMAELTELTRALKEQAAAFENLEETADLPEDYRITENPEHELKGKPGPGGGIDLTPFHAGFVLTALMVNSPRRETALATWGAWHLSQEGSTLSGWGDNFRPTIATCPLTGQHLFGNAFKVILSTSALASRVRRMRIDQGRQWAEIVYDKDKVSRFVSRGSKMSPNLNRVSELDGEVVNTTLLWISQ